MDLINPIIADRLGRYLLFWRLNLGLNVMTDHVNNFTLLLVVTGSSFPRQARKEFGLGQSL